MKEIKVKYYLFYYIGDEEDADGSLYAYTDNHHLYKIFKRDRDMTKFRCKIQYLTKEEIRYMAEEYKDLYLIIRTLKFVNRESGKCFNADMVMTDCESMTVHVKSSSLLLQELPLHCWINPRIFNKKIYKVLHDIGYISFYNSIHGKEDEDIKVIPDEVAIFIKLYGKTLKGS